MNPIDSGRRLLGQVRQRADQAVDRAQEAVGNVVNTVRDTAVEGARQVDRFVDGAEDRVVRSARAVNEFFGGGNQPDRVHDGQFVGAGGRTFAPGTPLSAIPGVLPRDNPRPTQTLIYVNGIRTDLATQSNSLQAIADRTGARVVGIHNSTTGSGADVIQTITDKMDLGRNPPVDTLADTVYTELRAGRSVHLMAHSHGGIITSRALNDVARRMRIEDGMSREQVEQALSRVNVETFGAAAMNYPDGPNYVHYVNRDDFVPSSFGLGNGTGVDERLRNPGRGAVVHRFDQEADAHGMDTTYLSRRVPFDQARQGQF